MGLPRPLGPWAATLAGLPAELIEALGPWLPRLDQALGALPRQTRRGHGEPDGYDGLSRRGPYERLLMTEWLLADEAPEEFLRRATTGEHAFLALSRQQPQVGRRVRVLFDAGPLQLGAPRLAHLALLLVMARRAAAGRAVLQWGVLQGEPAGMRTDADVPGLNVLLAGRSARAATEADRAAWRADLQTDDEVWEIGPPGPRSPGRIFIETIRPPALRVTLCRPGGVREVTLPLPPPEPSRALLRQITTEAAPPPPVRPIALGGLAFSAAGNRLLFRNRQGGVVQQPITGGLARRPANNTSGRHIFAADAFASQAQILETDGRRVFLRGAGTQQREKVYDPEGFPIPGPDAPLHLLLGSATQPTFLAEDGRLVRCQEGGRLRILAEGVLAACGERGVGTIHAVMTGALTRLHTVDSYGGLWSTPRLTFEVPQVRHALLGWRDGHGHLVGLSRDGQLWTCYDGEATRTLFLMEPGPAIGLVFHPSHGIALVQRRAENDGVWLVSTDKATTLRAHEPLVAVAVSQAAPNLAWRTTGGSIQVWDLRTGRTRLVPAHLVDP